EIPDVISSSSPTLFEKMSEPEEIAETIEASDDAQLPADDDLDYPNVIEIADKVETELDSWKTELNDLDEVMEDEELTDFDTNEESTTSEEDVIRLQAQIADETDNDLWSVDEEII